MLLRELRSEVEAERAAVELVLAEIASLDADTNEHDPTVSEGISKMHDTPAGWSD